MNITISENIDYQKCVKIVKTLNDYYNGNTELATVEYPQNISYKSNEYFIFMFYSCLLNYGMRSKIYNQNLINTYLKYPSIFNPNKVINMNSDKLKDIIIKNIHPRYPNIGTKKWIKLSKQLSNYKDITKELENIKNIDVLTKFIKNIECFGQKTGNLLIRIIKDTEVCDFTANIENIPIDRHDIEISYLTGITNKLKLSNKEIENLSKYYVQACKELNINPSNLDKYLWELGSTFCNKKKCIECPLNKYCKRSESNG